MQILEYRRDGFTISTDRDRLDLGMVHDFLSTESYWASGRSFESVKRLIENSLCFGIYQGDKQIGFARLMTNFATFAWLCDVFILEGYRGLGLGKWLVSMVIATPGFAQVNFILATKDAHELYRYYAGFNELQKPDHWMMRRGDEA